MRDRLVAHMPHYAPYLARIPWLANARDAVPGLAGLSETVCRPVQTANLAEMAGRQLSPRRGWRDCRGKTGVSCSVTRSTPISTARTCMPRAPCWPQAGFRSSRRCLKAHHGPPCCGRTYLASGLVDEARAEARRLIAAYLPLVRQGAKIVGLEPSCLLTLRDELTAMKLGPEAEEIAAAAMMFEEFVVEHADRFKFTSLESQRAAAWSLPSKGA